MGSRFLLWYGECLRCCMLSGVEPRQAAVTAGLRYVTDKTPGIRRLRVGKRFRYVTPHGNTLSDRNELERISSLAIPPAWRDVWICPSPNGHLQATGRDAKGRKQHRYHPSWREVRDESKYGHILEFAAALPVIAPTGAGRSRELRALPPKRHRGRRPAAREDADSRRQRRVRAQQPVVWPDDAEKSPRDRSRGRRSDSGFAASPASSTTSRSATRLARVVRRCQELPGRELFQYLDDEATSRISTRPM